MATSPDDLPAQLARAQTDLDELRRDLPKLEALLEKHEGAERAATSAARRDPAKLDALTEVRQRREAVESMVSQHRADIAQAETRVRTLQADLERDRACERIRTIYKEIDARRAPWGGEVLTAVNRFIEDAIRLGSERRHLMELYRESTRLRDQLTNEIANPAERANLLRELDIAEPQSLRDGAPQDWLPRHLTVPLEPDLNRTLTNFETILTVPHPNLDRLTIRARAPKE